jgi:hypothetical protein
MTRAFASAGVALLLAALVLTNCTDSLNAILGKEDPKINPNIYPQNYRRAVVTFIANNEHTINIHEAMISEPALRQLDNIERYVSCVKYSAGGGTVTEHKVYFIGGQINQFVKAAPGECSWASYQPFPEAEKICVGDKCK